MVDEEKEVRWKVREIKRITLMVCPFVDRNCTPDCIAYIPAYIKRYQNGETRKIKARCERMDAYDGIVQAIGDLVAPL